MEPIRRPQKKRAEGQQPKSALKNTVSDSNNTNLPKKWQRVLRAFASGKSFNRFDAERHLNDHCLHTTVSTLQRMGIAVAREFETVPGYMGIPTRVCRYWLDRSSDNISRAAALLPTSQQQGGAHG